MTHWHDGPGAGSCTSERVTVIAVATPRNCARSTSIGDIRKFCLRQLVRETVYRAKYRQKRFRGLEGALYVRGGTIKVTDTVIQFVNELPVGKPRVLPVRASSQPTGKMHRPWKLEYHDGIQEHPTKSSWKHR